MILASENPLVSNGKFYVLIGDDLNTDLILSTDKSLSAQLSSVHKISHTYTRCSVYTHTHTHSISMTFTVLARFRSDYHVKNDKNMFTSTTTKLSMPETSSG